MPDLACPRCGCPVDDSVDCITQPHKAAVAGDIYACRNCHQPSIYAYLGGVLWLRPPFLNELIEILNDPRYQALLVAFHTDNYEEEEEVIKKGIEEARRRRQAPNN